MDEVNDGGPAFPATVATWDDDAWPCHERNGGGFVNDAHEAPGMSLRDFLAAKALPVAAEAIAFGLRKDGDNPYYTYEEEATANMVAESAYCIADAMLRFRKVKIE